MEEYARPAEPGFSLVVHGWLRRCWNPRCVSRRINFLAKRRRRRRRRAPRLRERGRAKPRLRPRVVERVLAAGVRTRGEHSHEHGAERHAPPTSLCRGGECAYVRVKSGPPIDSEQLRAGLDRPVSPFLLRHPRRPRGAPRHPASWRCSPFRPYVVLCVCIRKMNALLPRGEWSCHDVLPSSFFEIYHYRYSIRPPIWISVCLFAGLALLYRCVSLG